MIQKNPRISKSPGFLFLKMRMEYSKTLWYNHFVVLPIPGNGRRCLDGSCYFLFCYCYGRRGLPLRLQMAWQERQGQQIAWWVLCHRKKKRRSPGLCWNTVRGFVLCPDGLIIAFAYWHYSICKSEMQYSLQGFQDIFPRSLSIKHGFGWTYAW